MESVITPTSALDERRAPGDVMSSRSTSLVGSCAEGTNSSSDGNGRAKISSRGTVGSLKNLSPGGFLPSSAC